MCIDGQVPACTWTVTLQRCSAAHNTTQYTGLGHIQASTCQILWSLPMPHRCTLLTYIHIRMYMHTCINNRQTCCLEYHKCCNTTRTGGLVVADVRMCSTYEWHSYLVDCPAPIWDVLYGWGWSRTQANAFDLQLKVILYHLVFSHQHCRIYSVSCTAQSHRTLSQTVTHNYKYSFNIRHYMNVQNVTISSTMCNGCLPRQTGVVHSRFMTHSCILRLLGFGSHCKTAKTTANTFQNIKIIKKTQNFTFPNVKCEHNIVSVTKKSRGTARNICSV